MVDYFGASTGAAEASASGAAQPAATGDANMDDEILVSPAYCFLNDCLLILCSKFEGIHTWSRTEDYG